METIITVSACMRDLSNVSPSHGKAQLQCRVSRVMQPDESQSAAVGRNSVRCSVLGNCVGYTEGTRQPI
eukprot:1619444-Pleurochrysis_carterae.AAC.1